METVEQEVKRHHGYMMKFLMFWLLLLGFGMFFAPAQPDLASKICVSFMQAFYLFMAGFIGNQWFEGQF